MADAEPTNAFVTEIWRYPIKSLQGEQLTDAEIESDGLSGDRRWGIRDATTGKILTARREPRLLLAAARVTEHDRPEITFPNGARVLGPGPNADDALSRWLDRPVNLVAAADSAAGSAEYFADATDDSSRAIEWTMPTGRFVDAMALLVLTTASLRAGTALHPPGNWNTRRFRPNVVVDVGSNANGWIEDEWCGQTLRIGAATVLPREPCIRCTMVVRPQPGLERDVDIYKTLSRHHHGTFGVWCEVGIRGSISIGGFVTIS